MPCYYYKCSNCGEGIEEVRPIAERNEQGPTCLHCGYHTTRTLDKQYPAINTSESASCLDGMRKNDDVWQRAKRAAQLKCDHAAATSEEDRKEIRKELKAQSKSGKLDKDVLK